jgi:hypothetical protein
VNMKSQFIALPLNVQTMPGSKFAIRAAMSLVWLTIYKWLLCGHRKRT